MTAQEAGELLGHQAQLELLEKMAASGTTPHALLLSGPPAVGKRLAALWFATRLLTPRALEPEAARRQIFSNTFPDLHILAREPESRGITVEGLRSLCDELMLKPYYGGRRAAIIDDAHHLSLAAANALLKTLEEPPPNTHIILVTDAPHRLPETVISRCQQVPFGPLSQDELQRVLARLLDACSLSPELADALLTLCDGTLAPLQLEAFLDRATGKPVALEAMREHLEALSGSVKALRKVLREMDRDQPRPSSVVRACNTLFGKKEQLQLARTVARQEVRRRLLEKPSEARADALLRFLEAERLIDQRSAQAQLQLSAAMIRAYCG